MTVGSGIAIYFVIWWTTLFIILPIGVRSQREVGTVVPGSDPGAPAVTRFGRIVAINSLVAGVAFGVYYFLISPLIP